MTKQRRFTKDFENEAVRLALTSGRTQREIAEDLGSESKVVLLKGQLTRTSAGEATWTCSGKVESSR